MGEYGISRHEFLYEIRFWEARRIVRGYRKRGILNRQLLAENVYASTFAFRGSNGKTVKDLFPSLFKEDEDEYETPQLTDEDRAELQALMDAENAIIRSETPK